VSSSRYSPLNPGNDESWAKIDNAAKQTATAPERKKDRDREAFISFGRSTAHILAEERDRLGNFFHHGRFGAKPLHAVERTQRGRGNHIPAPDQSGSFSFHGHWPHLIKRERHVIATARVVEHIGRLMGAIRGRFVVRGAERDASLIVRVQQLPIHFRRNPAATPDSGLAEKSGELFSDLLLLFQERIQF